MLDESKFDISKLNRELDRVKSKVFLGKNAAFLATLMCSMEFVWSDHVQTAATNGLTLWWNPEFFMSLDPKVRETVLVHELWHPAFLHMLRRGSRNPKIWNYAADIVINNQLDSEGYSFEGTSPWLDHSYDGWNTEDIYDDLYKKGEEYLQQSMPMYQWVNPGSGIGDETDIIEPGENGTDDSPGAKSQAAQIAHAITNNVVMASHNAKLAGDLPGNVEVILKQFLEPKLPWKNLLQNFFNQLCTQDYSWSRPNRRYNDMYLPSLQDQQEALDHLVYYLDVSGSISEMDIIRFHSEFKYVKETFVPEKMTMVQFDTIIQKEEVFERDRPFEEIHVIGRGGTSLVCVRDHILENKPTAAVIFSDLYCDVMEKLPIGSEIPIIWICVNNRSARVNEGQLIHIKE